ncbi:aminopeptidase [Adhaeribacter aerolatus]|uniref:Aminopeptidase n=1 Tax=Adhaeribacter aerolatus TaxID=670289 RepID=A0A512AUS5_9BACT|nr:M28 family metallopeptidase [Adhaeribacter aerolatus]GEO03464.1 aminopeptidase [Adhaeribacter aerolatus]
MQLLSNRSIKPTKNRFTGKAFAGAIFFLCSLVFSLPGQAQYHKQLKAKEVKQAISGVNPEAIKAHMTFLSDDLLAGRRPGKPGFGIAARYMAAQFEGLGLQPGGDNNTYLQAVPLRSGVVTEAQSAFKVNRNGQEQALTYLTDFVLQPNMGQAQSQVSAPVVFVGYGVSAPELGYDDYANQDVRGKIVMYLSGAPAKFPNNEKAYFSSPATKNATAAQRGAVGAIMVIAAGENNATWNAYAKRVRSGSTWWAGPNGTPNTYLPELKGLAVVSQGVGDSFFAGTGTNLLQAAAALRDGKPASVNLPVSVSLTTSTKYSDIPSHNVVAILPGSDPQLKHEYVVYAAHLDHLGLSTPVNGDSINNGAHDNASGSAFLIETARAFKSLPKAPKRSIIFLSCTGEELGLQGSDYFASNPTVPAGSLVANLAIDMPFFFYPLRDIIPHGIQHSSLRGPVEATAQYLGLKITPDPAPEEVVFTRSDHYSFIKKGIPALFIKGGIITGDPNKDGAKIIADWRKTIYHKPQDDMNQPFDFNAAAMHVKTNFLIGYLTANESKRPTWNKGDFFGGKFGEKNKPETEKEDSGS